MLALGHDDAGGSGDCKEQVQPAEPADEVHSPLPEDEHDEQRDVVGNRQGEVER
jgi:hypothetical protein